METSIIYVSLVHRPRIICLSFVLKRNCIYINVHIGCTDKASKKSQTDNKDDSLRQEHDTV